MVFLQGSTSAIASFRRLPCSWDMVKEMEGSSLPWICVIFQDLSLDAPLHPLCDVGQGAREPTMLLAISTGLTVAIWARDQCPPTCPETWCLWVS